MGFASSEVSAPSRGVIVLMPTAPAQGERGTRQHAGVGEKQREEARPLIEIEGGG